MGNWNITIRGTGSHHNKAHAEDANRMAAEFVQKLRDVGHTISHASITYGGEDDLTQPKRYLDDRDAIDGAEQRRPRCGAELPPPTEGDCPAKQGVFSFCPDKGCSVHGVNAPKRACRLVDGHEGGHAPPVNWEPF